MPKSKTSTSALTRGEVRVLQALVAADGELLHRRELEEKWGASSLILGAATRDGLGKQGGGLESKGLITSIFNPEECRFIQYSITQEGRKALKEALKAIEGRSGTTTARTAASRNQ